MFLKTYDPIDFQQMHLWKVDVKLDLRNTKKVIRNHLDGLSKYLGVLIFLSEAILM